MALELGEIRAALKSTEPGQCVTETRAILRWAFVLASGSLSEPVHAYFRPRRGPAPDFLLLMGGRRLGRIFYSSYIAWCN